MSTSLKRIISSALALVLIFGLALSPDTAAMLTAGAATAYDLWVNGEQFTSDRLTIPCGTGTAVYSPDNSTLTLNDAIITKADADGGAICAVSGSALTILLNGSSVILAPGDDAISSLSGSITIDDGEESGIGSLTAAASSYAIYSGSNINLRGGRFDLTASGTYGCAVKAVGNVNITGGTVALSGGAEGSNITAAKVVISGGSVKSAAAALSPAPVNSGGTELTLLEHTVASVSAASQVHSLKITYGTSDYSYGINSLFTDNSGKVYLWIPSGAFVADSSITTTTSTTSSTSSTTSTTTTTQPANDAPPYVRMTGNNINLRTSAPSGDVIRTLPIFACYPCTDVTTVGSTKWYKIKVGSDEGWVSGTYAAEETAGDYIKITGENVNVRKTAPSGMPIDTVSAPNHYKYSATATHGGVTWYKISLGSVSGWVSGEYCEKVASSTSSSADGSSTSSTTTTTTKPAVTSGWLRITGTNINVRGTAGTTDTSDVLVKVNKNAWYPFSDTTSISGTTWYKIAVGTTEGWVSGRYAAVATADANYIRITGTSLNVRTVAGTGTVIGTVKLNECYPYTATTDLGGTTCYKITFGNQSGWVVGTFVEVVGASTGGSTNASGTESTTTTTTGTTAPAAKPAKDYVQAVVGGINVRNAAQGTTVITTITQQMKNGWFKYTDVNTISDVKWYKIVIGNQSGWVSGSYVTPATKEAKYVQVTSNLVNVRNEANGTQVVAQVPRYCNYPFTETKKVDNDLWYKITVGTTEGWINGKYVKLSDPDTSTTTSTTTTTTTTKSTTSTTTTTKPPALDGTKRIYGDTRIDTAIAISKEGWSGVANSVVLAYSQSYADALAGVSLAAALDAPILLTGGVTLEASVKAEIERLRATKIYILGGTGVISAALENSLRASYTVTRLSGSNRYETAVAIAKELRTVTGKDFTALYFASAANFPDALSISPVAAIQGNPVLYAPATGALDSATAEYIEDLGCGSAVIIGGTGAVSDDARNSMLTCGITSVERIGEKNRYETSLKINTTYNHLFTGSGISISTGKNFPDALAGGALSAKNKLPIILIDKNVTVSGLKSYISGRGYRTAYIYGGANAVSNDTVSGIIS